MSEIKSDKFGDANFNDTGSNSQRFKKLLKIKGGEAGTQTHNLFRIYPPILDQVYTGKWALWEATHEGYYGVSRSDPTKAFPRSFLCPLKKFGDKVEVPCKECDNIEKKRAERKALDPSEGEDKKNRDLSKLTPGQIERLKFLDLFLDGAEKGAGAHRRKLRVRLNAFSKSEGQGGLLRISPTLFYKIKAKNKKEEVTNPGLIDTYLQRGINALAPNQGLWFDIIRTGNGSGRGAGNAADQVVVYKEADPKDPTVERAVPAPLSEGSPQLIAVDQCFDLTDDSHTARVTPEQVEQLVALWEAGEHTPENVDLVLDGEKEVKRGALAQPPTTFRPEEDGDDEAAFQPVPVAQASVTIMVPQPTPAPVVTTPKPATPAPAPPTPATATSADAKPDAVKDIIAKVKAKQAAEKAAREAAQTAAK